MSEIGLGCMGMSEFYGADATTPSRCARSIARSNSASTSSTPPTCTASAANEELVGRAIAGRRDEVFLATKFGIVRDEDDAERARRSAASRTTCARRATRRSSGSASITSTSTTSTASIRRRRSKRRSARCTSSSVAGKVRYLGLSEAAPDDDPPRRRDRIRSRRCRASTRCSAATSRTTACSIRSASSASRSSRTARSAAALLTAAITTVDELAPERFPAHNPRYQGDNFERNLRDRRRSSTSSRAKPASRPAQLVLAWVLAQGEDVIPIPGTKRVKYLEENAAAAEVRLTPEQLAAHRRDRAARRRRRRPLRGHVDGKPVDEERYRPSR